MWSSLSFIFFHFFIQNAYHTLEDWSIILVVTVVVFVSCSFTSLFWSTRKSSFLIDLTDFETFFWVRLLDVNIVWIRRKIENIFSFQIFSINFLRRIDYSKTKLDDLGGFRYDCAISCISYVTHICSIIPKQTFSVIIVFFYRYIYIYPI